MLMYWDLHHQMRTYTICNRRHTMNNDIICNNIIYQYYTILIQYLLEHIKVLEICYFTHNKSATGMKAFLTTQCSLINKCSALSDKRKKSRLSVCTNKIKGMNNYSSNYSSGELKQFYSAPLCVSVSLAVRSGCMQRHLSNSKHSLHTCISGHTNRTDSFSQILYIGIDGALKS